MDWSYKYTNGTGIEKEKNEDYLVLGSVKIMPYCSCAPCVIILLQSIIYSSDIYKMQKYVCCFGSALIIHAHQKSSIM